MKTRMIFLITVLAVMFGGTSAIGLADEHEETPEANTGFVAQVSDESVDEGADPEAETLYIQYHVCSLNEEADDYCDETLDEFDPETFEWVNEIAVEPNEAGEFNHGSFVSAFAQGVETTGPGKGCLMRFVAQSNWGMPGVDLEGYEVLEQAEIHCAFNRTVDGDEDGEGPPPWAGIGKKKWEAEQSSAESTAGGPPAWAGKKGGPGGSDD